MKSNSGINLKTARIIVLAGQSNAVGVGHIEYLSRRFSKEKVEKFLCGYEDILINYYSHDKKSEGFVKTSVGCTEINKEPEKEIDPAHYDSDCTIKLGNLFAEKMRFENAD